ncbi:(Fe-S)-binding protein [Desulfovibrionales bacterium]
MVDRPCILCGRCLEVCPLVAVTGREELSPKAKQQLSAALADLALSEVTVPQAAGLSGRAIVDLAGLCLSCGRCVAACPQGLAGAEIVASLRAAYSDWRQWLWKIWLEYGGLWSVAVGLGHILQKSVVTMGIWNGVAMSTLNCPPAAQRATGTASQLAPWLRVTRFDITADRAHIGTAAIFPGCLAGLVTIPWLATVEWVLVGLGFRLASTADGPGWGCCGATLGHAGLPEARLEVAQRNLAQWRALGRPLVVTFCASCRAGLASYAVDSALNWVVSLWEPGEAEVWIASLQPLAFLWGETDFVVEPWAPKTICYHQPCHALPDDFDLVWLHRVLGERLRFPGSGRCCGLGGGVMQMVAPGLAAKVTAALWEMLVTPNGRAETSVFTGCIGCLLRLKVTAPAGVVVGHWLEILLPLRS